MFGISYQRVQQILKRRGINGSGGGATKRAELKNARREKARNIYCLRTKGCVYEDYLKLLQIGRDRMARGVTRERTPIGAFVRQKQGARRRRIEWRLSLWDWWTIWQQSGRWDERGRGQGYVMCRKGDTGAYEIGNVYIDTCRQNSSDGNKVDTHLPLGVTVNRGGPGYRAERMIDRKMFRLGIFNTVKEASIAYQSAGK